MSKNKGALMIKVMGILRQLGSVDAEERKEFLKLLTDTLGSSDALEDARSILESRGIVVEQEHFDDLRNELDAKITASPEGDIET